ncbi:uncharacterized protein ACLA_020540 [Aspergillus clavatus NRRL 1]|uniref:Uncharacterized protein n=1 Tax=Aspergillus clavatus (strain ATCC 1007 / CBS 513.65 / DSM 816 / NCTC 3887 / NRRL 1 / QM 1276 / 107) TaxID=344612 RepID=A1CNX6_ASPCL|nr:uncharacterized protein ACLA_020540 [Aspergillus clavatus NRRL 1]EAW07347.1 hypothetical protein ACLA_020540 [Aspergillus clavatus NRRL 1]
MGDPNRWLESCLQAKIFGLDKVVKSVTKAMKVLACVRRRQLQKLLQSEDYMLHADL